MSGCEVSELLPRSQRTLTGLILNIALNLALIPRFSVRGAAIATLATESVVFLFLWREFVRMPGISSGPFLRVVSRTIVPLTASVTVGVATGRFLPWAVSAVLTAGTYIALWFAPIARYHLTAKTS